MSGLTPYAATTAAVPTGHNLWTLVEEPKWGSYSSVTAADRWCIEDATGGFTPSDQASIEFLTHTSALKLLASHFTEYGMGEEKILGMIIDYTHVCGNEARIPKKFAAADVALTGSKNAKTGKFFDQAYWWKNFRIRMPFMGVTQEIVETCRVVKFKPTNFEVVMAVSPTVLIESSDPKKSGKWEMVPLTPGLLLERMKIPNSLKKGWCDPNLAVLTSPITRAGWVYVTTNPFEDGELEIDDRAPPISIGMNGPASAAEGLIATFLSMHQKGAKGNVRVCAAEFGCEEGGYPIQSLKLAYYEREHTCFGGPLMLDRIKAVVEFELNVKRFSGASTETAAAPAKESGCVIA
jgi:hypothetical protein